MRPEQDEVFIVDEGAYRFQCDQALFVLKAGDSIFLPRGLPHTFRQLSTAGKLRTLYTEPHGVSLAGGGGLRGLQAPVRQLAVLNQSIRSPARQTCESIHTV